VKSAAIVLAVAWVGPACAAAGEAVDWLGDPLPTGAVQRLGTRRMRYTYSPRDLAYSYDSARALVAIGKTLEVWDLTRGERLGSYEVCEGAAELRLVAASRRGPVALLADSAGVVSEWDFEKPQLLGEFPTGRERLVSLRYSPDEQRVLTLDAATSTVEEWDKATGKRLIAIEPGEARFACCIYGPRGKTAFVGSSDHRGDGPNVFHYDLGTGKLLKGLLPSGWVGVYDLDLSPDGERVLARLRYAPTTEWRLSDYEVVGQGFKAAGRPGPSARYAGDERWLLTGSRDGIVRVWDRHTGEVVRKWGPHKGWVRMIRVSPDGKWALSCGDGHLIADINIETGQPRLPWARHTSAVQTLGLSGNGSRLVTGSLDRTIRVWEWEGEGWKGGSTINVPGAGVMAAAVSPDGQRVLAGSTDGVIREFDIATHQPTHLLRGHYGHVHAIIYLDAHQALSAADDGSVRLWDIEKEEPVHVMTGHLGGILGLAVSPDGRRALSVGRDCSLREWDLTSGRSLHSTLAHRGEVYAVAYSPDGHYAVTGGRDGLVVEWDLAEWQPLRTFRHGAWVKAMGYLPDGATIASGGADGKVLLWSRDTAQPVQTLSGHTGAVNALAVSPDGNRLVSGSDDTAALVWGLQ